MFLVRYSRYALRPNSFPPNLSVKKISNEPLHKAEVPEANFGQNKAEDAAPREQGPAPPSHPAERAESRAPAEAPRALIRGKDAAELLLNADPFEEVPGPEFLKKMSTLWKYVPEIGCQATVSAMLSFFNVRQKFLEMARLGKPNSRPFDGLFKKYGPIVKLQGPLGADVVLICKPEHVAKIYDQEGKYPVRSTLDSVEKCRAKTRKNCGGPFNMSGIEWEDMRKALREPLLKGGERYYEAIEEAAEMFVRRIRAIRNRQNEVPEDFMKEITKWGMECLCQVTLGKSLGFHHPETANASSMEPVRLLVAVSVATASICKCESGFQLWRFMNTSSFNDLCQACEVIDGFISKHIRLAQVNLTKNREPAAGAGEVGPSEGLSFIENLLLNECMAPDEVLTCIVDLLLIGANATSSSLAFALYHLAQNQRSQRLLFKETKEFLPEKDSRLPLDALPSMKYLAACIDESHRLRMPMPTLTRVLPHDIVLSNFRIPKGAYVVMDVQAACLKEQNFEKCDKFYPERWLEPSGIHPFSFVPFGHGSRSCLGKRLAEVQLKTCIARVIRNYEIEYNYGEIHGTKTVISFPERPLKFTFTEREE